MRAWIAGAMLAGSLGWWSPPRWLEGLLHNPRERTAEGIAAYRAGDAERSLAPLSSALRLAPDKPLTRYNAGTATLVAGRDGAARLLEAASERADPALLPLVYYNLGNSRLDDGDVAGAVEAYKHSLRETPDFLDAKHNLEVALERLRRERSGLRPPRETPEGEQPGDEEQSSQPGADLPPDAGEPHDRPSQPDDRGERSGASSDPEPAESQRADDGAARPLPDFQDQPDMTAEQAAAILEAVENLEREQRRERAARAAAARGRGAKDW